MQKSTELEQQPQKTMSKPEFLNSKNREQQSTGQQVRAPGGPANGSKLKKRKKQLHTGRWRARKAESHDVIVSRKHVNARATQDAATVVFVRTV